MLHGFKSITESRSLVYTSSLCLFWQNRVNHFFENYHLSLKWDVRDKRRHAAVIFPFWETSVGPPTFHSFGRRADGICVYGLLIRNRWRSELGSCTLYNREVKHSIFHTELSCSFSHTGAHSVLLSLSLPIPLKLKGTYGKSYKQLGFHLPSQDLLWVNLWPNIIAFLRRDGVIHRNHGFLVLKVSVNVCQSIREMLQRNS